MCALPYTLDSLSKYFGGLLRAQPCFGVLGLRWFGGDVVIVTVVSFH